MSENGQGPKVVATFTFFLLENNAIPTKGEGPFPAALLNMAMDVQKARMAGAMLQAEQQAMMQQQALQKRVLMPDGSVPPPGI